MPGVKDTYRRSPAATAITRGLSTTTGCRRRRRERSRSFRRLPGCGRTDCRGLPSHADHSLYATVVGHRGAWRRSLALHRSTVDPTARRGFCSASCGPPYLDSQSRLWIGRQRRVKSGCMPEGARSCFTSGEPGLGHVFALLETSRGLFAAGKRSGGPARRAICAAVIRRSRLRARRARLGRVTQRRSLAERGQRHCARHGGRARCRPGNAAVSA